MITTELDQAAAQLSRLVEQALAGEEVVIAEAGRALVKLTPFPEYRPRRRTSRDALFGCMRGEIAFAADYDRADAEIQALFEESEQSSPLRGTARQAPGSRG